MSRFTRFSRFSPAQLQRSRERRAWLSLALTLGLVAGTGILLARQFLLFTCGSNSSFIGVTYEQAVQETPRTAPLSAQITPPTPAVFPRLPQPNAPDALLPEMVDCTDLSNLADTPIPPEVWSDEGIPQPRHPVADRPAPRFEKAVTVCAATPLHAPHPSYPGSMRQRRMEGDVGICIHINAEGIPTAVDILTDVHPDFAEHTRRWILRYWRFRAARKGTVAIISTLRTTIRYRL